MSLLGGLDELDEVDGWGCENGSFNSSAFDAKMLPGLAPSRVLASYDPLPTDLSRDSSSGTPRTDRKKLCTGDCVQLLTVGIRPVKPQSGPASCMPFYL